jgi:uncharacterized protein
MSPPSPVRAASALGSATEWLAAFCRYLRERGLPAGVGAEVDLGAALQAIDPLDRSAVRDACLVTLAKSPEDLRVVGDGFDEFFGAGAARTQRRIARVELAYRRPRRRPGPRSTEDRQLSVSVVSAEVAVPVGTYSPNAPAARHPIEPLSEAALRRLRRGARRFRRHLATIPGRRAVPGRRGPVDLRDTVRRGLGEGGEWVVLRRRHARPSRAELLILWDVSGSMREHESRFFGLVHALVTTNRRARVFAFSTRVEDVTADVRRGSYPRAAATLGARLGRADGGTRIGPALRAIAERERTLLRPSMMFVVLSDGWDLGEGTDVGRELSEIRSRVGRVVWVTPYTRLSGFEPRVGALTAALPWIDELLGPEDFEARWPLRPYST